MVLYTPKMGKLDSEKIDSDSVPDPKTNAAFTYFGYQERNLTFVKTNFHGLKLNFHARNYKQALCPPFHKLYVKERS